MIGWFKLVLTCQPIILFYNRGNFVYHHFGCSLLIFSFLKIRPNFERQVALPLSSRRRWKEKSRKVSLLDTPYSCLFLNWGRRCEGIYISKELNRFIGYWDPLKLCQKWSMWRNTNEGLSISFFRGFVSHFSSHLPHFITSHELFLTQF